MRLFLFVVYFYSLKVFFFNYESMITHAVIIRALSGFPDSSAGKKNPPAMQETPVRFLGWEDPLEKG